MNATTCARRVLAQRPVTSRRSSLSRRLKSTLPPPPPPTTPSAAASKSALPSASATTTAQQQQKTVGLLQRAWKAYCEALTKQPLLTKASTASLIFFSSDAATQYLLPDEDSDSNEFNVTRAASGAAFGVFGTTWLHYWWGFLESFGARRIPIAKYGRLANTVGKVAIDQILAAPVYYYGYYVLTNFIQKFMAEYYASDNNNNNNNNNNNPKSASELLQETQEKASEMIMPTMQRHWSIWPAIHTVNFYYNPLQHRVLVQNLCLVGWSGCKSKRLLFVQNLLVVMEYDCTSHPIPIHCCSSSSVQTSAI